LFTAAEQLTFFFDPRQIRVVAAEYGVTTSIINSALGAAREELARLPYCKHRWSQLFDDVGKEVARDCPKCGCGKE